MSSTGSYGSPSTPLCPRRLTAQTTIIRLPALWFPVGFGQWNALAGDRRGRRVTPLGPLWLDGPSTESYSSSYGTASLRLQVLVITSTPHPLGSRGVTSSPL